MKALKQFLVLAAFCLGAEVVIAYAIISDHEAQKSRLESQDQSIGQSTIVENQ